MRLRARILADSLCVCLIATAAACGARTGLYADHDGGDATAPVADAAPDAPSDEPCSAALAGYHDIHDARFWSTFDLAPVIPARFSPGYEGAAFDGRYVYLVPSGFNPGGVAARYDTTAGFGSLASWSVFDIASVDSRAAAFNGAAFDGRYVYFVPGYDPAQPHVMARYDTRADFQSPAAWTTFDPMTLNLVTREYRGAVFDGTYVYFVPRGPDVLRFDTRLTFTSPSSWTHFDNRALGEGFAAAWHGGVFDGRYVYFPPAAGNGPNDAVRYDTHADFLDAGSWANFSTDGYLSPPADGFLGEGFDGTYVYFVPFIGDQFSRTGLTARFDTREPFQDASSWSVFDVTGVNPKAGEFAGAAFDGRFLYLVPNGVGGAGVAPQGDRGTVARYDTTAPFANTGSWSTFDMTTLNPQAAGFFGAAFDGRFVYFVPTFGTVVARFDAKCPSSLPHGYSGSFF